MIHQKHLNVHARRILVIHSKMFSWSLLNEVLVGVILILTGIYFYFKYYVYQFWSKRGVFNPEPVVPFGHAWSYVARSSSFADIFRANYEKYKTEHRYFGLYLMTWPVLVLVDPELIKIILAKEFTNFHDRGIYVNEQTDPLMGNLFFLPGKKWRNLRVKLTPTFTGAKMKQMFATVKEIGTELNKYLDNHVRTTDGNIEMKDVFARFTTDVIMSTAFGVDCNSLHNPDSEFRSWGKRIFAPRRLVTSLYVFSKWFVRFFSIPFLDQKLSAFFINTFKENVSYRIENKVIRHDFMNLLIQLMENGYVAPDADEKECSTNEDPVRSGKLEKLSMLEGAAQAFIFMVAGFETSSSTATYCVYELATNQDIQNKLHQEITQVIEKHGELTYDSINDMVYLHQVVSETMRKYPPLPNLTRICTKETTLPGSDVHIPKRMKIIIPILGIHHDPRVYPDPDKFCPERFTPENKSTRHPFSYLPFGEGPRACIGLRFGLMQVKVALISALTNFKFRLAPHTKVPLDLEVNSLVMTIKGGVDLIVEPR